MFSKSVLTTLLAIPFVAQAVLATQSDCTREYTVQPGDFCDSISAAQNVSTYQLAVVNYGIINQDCSNLYPGEQLCLGHTGEDCTDTYVVEACDTCEDISNKTGVPLDQLYVNNPQIDDDCSNIYVGEVLCVATTPTVPDVPDDCEVDIPRHGPWANDGDDGHHGGDDDDDCDDDDNGDDDDDCDDDDDYDDDCDDDDDNDGDYDDDDDDDSSPTTTQR